MWSTAAQIYLLAPAGGPAARDLAAQAVRKAVLAGKDPQSVKLNAVLKTLVGHPLYEQALTSAPGPLIPSANPYLANPIP